jgi:hypothetical protein
LFDLVSAIGALIAGLSSRYSRPKDAQRHAPGVPGSVTRRSPLKLLVLVTQQITIPSEQLHACTAIGVKPDRTKRVRQRRANIYPVASIVEDANGFIHFTKLTFDF